MSANNYFHHDTLECSSVADVRGVVNERVDWVRLRMNNGIGDRCPNCADAGRLYIFNLHVKCDHCDYERFSTQQELDTHVNQEKQCSPRLLTLIEEQPYIKPRVSRPMGMREFKIER